MTVIIDELISQVDVEPEAPSGAASVEAPWWEQLARLQRLEQRNLLDRARTAAWGNDD